MTRSLALTTGLLLIAGVARAHDCGPTQITLKVGETVDWTILSDMDEILTTYTPESPSGDSASLSPDSEFQDKDGNFTITALKPGTTFLGVQWVNNQGPGGSGFCSVEVIVEEDDTTPPPPRVRTRIFLGACIGVPDAPPFLVLYRDPDPQTEERKFFMFPLPDAPGGGEGELVFELCFWEQVLTGQLALLHGVMSACLLEQGQTSSCFGFDLTSVRLSDLAPSLPSGIMVGLVNLFFHVPDQEPVEVQNKPMLLVELSLPEPQ